ncbi:hypothetical protein ILUMI_06425 [Ignelater luminosus]|uniref:t-SNARE coiled-coil homology domain-containing protein n=1 Tax=Ignelater luminosus TaxID=2038154 RepID=A0A8K0DA07_IGNLU|nr:hypothetical protein ILUMI_06425 [Ignelater luminosus]
MSMVNTAIVKQPFKLIEIPLNKFRDEAVPHHQRVFETHKNNIHKHISSNNVEQIKWEIKDKKRIIRQLKDLMYELDTLRTQVEDSDLAKFDSKTLSLRKTILELISSYTNLENEAMQIISRNIEENNDKNQNPIQGISQLQVQENLSELKLNEKERQLRQVEALNKDIEDVHGIFTDLNQLAGEQKEHVNAIEANTEVASENINSGLRQLIQASKLKKASYPVAGAFIGTMVGGPIGSVAGLKIGGLAAIGCGVVGYFSGRFLKRSNDDPSLTEIENSENLSSGNVVSSTNEKKDI